MMGDNDVMDAKDMDKNMDLKWQEWQVTKLRPELNLCELLVSQVDHPSPKWCRAVVALELWFLKLYKSENNSPPPRTSQCSLASSPWKRSSMKLMVCNPQKSKRGNETSKKGPKTFPTVRPSSSSIRGAPGGTVDNNMIVDNNVTEDNNVRYFDDWWLINYGHGGWWKLWLIIANDCGFDRND